MDFERLNNFWRDGWWLWLSWLYIYSESDVFVPVFCDHSSFMFSRSFSVVHWKLGCWEADGQSNIVFISCYQFQGPPKQHLHQLVFSFLKLQEFKSLPREDPFRAPSAGKTLCGATINVDSKVWTWSPSMLLQRWGTKDGKRMWSSPALGT